jgi:putative ABC transport system permease protein
MKIPITYNLRNLVVRKTTTLLTALGIALTVAVLLAVLALTEGLRTSLEASGHPLQLIVTRKGATSELMSILLRKDFPIIQSQLGIQTGPDGVALASLELVTGISLESGNGVKVKNVTLRGILPVGLSMRNGLRLAAGRLFEPGRREIVVGRSITQRYPDAQLGKTIRFARGDWTIVGIADAGQAAGSNEIFADLNQVSATYNRPEALSSVLLRATDASAMQALRNNLENDPRLNLQAQPEKDYYAAQMSSAAPVRFIGSLVAALLAIGSSFAAMNTMYAAVSRRSAEIGTLRVLGFSRRSILTSFVLESLLLSLLGGLIGCALVAPLHHAGTSMSSVSTMTEFAFQFRLTPAAIVMGLVFGLLMGVIGGILPAWNASRKDVLAALRA